ncbi:uncharacterized protein RAG0_14803 [Rhynchosporium agropyri]|uniref:Uncharacterized protein n=1 Tax=Rhynchosporium agropyri TaxID=914238 RepID=A0A1E1LIC6_9HELO|nr:uncharacterized protein RAG0_14803 [Rhynchosporium agropyri]
MNISTLLALVIMAVGTSAAAMPKACDYDFCEGSNSASRLGNTATPKLADVGKQPGTPQRRVKSANSFGLLFWGWCLDYSCAKSPGGTSYFWLFMGIIDVSFWPSKTVVACSGR